MKTTHLQHHSGTGYLSAGRLRHLPAELRLPHPCSSFISFRACPVRKPDRVVRKLHAAQRPLDIYGEGAYCFYAVQSDSPLAPLLLWDGAHFLSVGEKISVIEETPLASYLDREYFANALKVVCRTPTSVTYEKVCRLPAESDDDLDAWTFGIPTGPGDATILNAVVKRILEIDIPEKEILLCGRPGDNFAYFDKVRIVGEDIAAPPVQICKKKNRLASEAAHSNLVILHDRVFMPRHFGDMVRRFGPRYPLMALHSLFFDNTLCMHPRRYSDNCMTMGEISQGLQGLHRHSGRSVEIATSTFPEIERTGFIFANAMRYSKDVSYPTGSLYICRKEVWSACPLDESLHWVEFEDVEHGVRASKAGIPNRINPYGITQSITSRPQLGQEALAESMRGRPVRFGPCMTSMLKKKPLIRMSAAVALARLREFEKKYSTNPDVTRVPTGLRSISARAWVALINDVVQRSAFRNDTESVQAFITDFEKLVLLDQMPSITREYWMNCFLLNPVHAKKAFITGSGEIRNMLRQRAFQTWFTNGAEDFFHHDILSLPGVVISAFRLYRCKHKIFYFESFKSAVKAIYNSTPFKSCLKVSK